jgi:hypothetical protein
MNKIIKYTNKIIGLRCNPVTTQPHKNTNGNKSFESVPIRLSQDSLFRRQATVIVAGHPADDSIKSPLSSYPGPPTKWFKIQPSDCPFGFFADPFPDWALTNL